MAVGRFRDELRKATALAFLRRCGVRLANGPDAIKLGGMKTLTAVIYPGETGRWLVAFNPETGTTTQGKTVEQALENLKEAVTLFLEEHPAPVRPGAILTTFEVEHA
jgi:predicted RNase H-like HicB family nuclease